MASDIKKRVKRNLFSEFNEAENWKASSAENSLILLVKFADPPKYTYNVDIKGSKIL